MNMRRILAHSIFIALLVSLPAHATMKIANCSDKTEIVTVDYYGEVRQVELEPNDSRYFYGRPREISLNDQTITLIHTDIEYCIRSGKLALQRRNRHDQRNR